MKHLRLIVILAVLIAVLVTVVIVIRGSGPHMPVSPSAPTWTPVTQEHLSHGRFEKLIVYSPHTTPRGFVLLLSGVDGWTARMNDMALRLAEHGAMVTGIDVAQLNAALEGDGGQCVYPDGDLENLSHFVQAYYRLPTYLTPILGGYSAGATLAYATLIQAPKNTFAGAVSVEFCPTYDLKKPLCKGSGIEFTPWSQGKGVEFLPYTQPGNSWTVVESGSGAGSGNGGGGRGAAGGNDGNPACDLATVRNFVEEVPGARLVGAAGEGTTPAAAAGETPSTNASAGEAPFIAAFDALMAQNPNAPAAAAPAALADLPIVTVPAEAGAAPSDLLAILLSGDGGWAGLDKEVAGALSAAGIPVIGVDSLRYFWSARTPEGLAKDLDRMAEYYLPQLHKQRILLIGYSQGADVLPFAVNRLNPATRSHVALTAVMGLSEHALFEFHVTSWVSDDDSGPATLPEVERITGMPVLCIYGDGETDTLCPKLDARKVTVVKLKGGHHFDGDYAGLARAILAATHR